LIKNRRRKMSVRRFIVFMLLLVAIPVAANAADEQEIQGIYVRMPEFKFDFDGKQVEIVEFFSFYCGHCYELEKFIPAIKGNFPKKIRWRSIPVYWGRASSKPGEAYLLAEEAGKGEQMKKALFETLFLEKRNIGDPAVLEDIGTRIGLGFDFSRRLRAGDKEKEAKAALIMMDSYKINETPSVVIAGNLRVNPSMGAGTLEFFRDNMITIIKSILAKPQ
jgi:thiol:disulfide interchange protein DsbA